MKPMKTSIATVSLSGTLGEKLGYHYGFAAAGVGMCLGLIIYLLASPLLPPDRAHLMTMVPSSGRAAVDGGA